MAMLFAKGGGFVGRWLAPVCVLILTSLMIEGGADAAFVGGLPAPGPRRLLSGRREHAVTMMAGGFGKKTAAGGSGFGKKNAGRVSKGGGAGKERVAKQPVASAPGQDATKNEVEAILDAVDETKDPFWQLVPHILNSEFDPREIKRVHGTIRFAEGDKGLTQDIIDDPMRPHEDIHAFMQGIPAAQFRDPALYPFCQELEDNYEAIKAEFKVLQEHENERFQSVTSMNYDSGWKTLVLFFNGHKIDGFPYHLCPVTTSILEKVPVAGRIAGFNRQAPGSGIPLHSDGNNMWLTCQMGVDVPSDESAWIRVGTEKKHWENGKTMVYDTTFEHETFNPNEEEDRIVLHVDFWNFKELSPTELTAMQRIYSLREAYLQAEGAIEVGNLGPRSGSG